MNTKKQLAFLLALALFSCNKKAENKTTTIETETTTKEIIVSKPIIVTDLPKNLVFEGVFKEGIYMKDSAGAHLIFLTETVEFQSKKIIDQEEEKDKKLFAYNYLLDPTDSKFKLNWKIQDFEANCGFDLYLNFIKNTFKTTDLNADGQAEIWTMYQKGCVSDVSPLEMKIIMYQGKQKFALRGSSLVNLGTEKIGGDYKLDKNLTEAPKEFQDYAVKLWNQNNIQKYD